MMERPNQIPDDLPACQQLLHGLFEQLRELEVQLTDLKRQLEETCATSSELQRSYDCLHEQYLVLKRLCFGPRTEKLAEAPGQGHLFDNDGPPPVPAEPAAAPAAAEAAGSKAKRGHGRRQIPAHLARTEIRHDVAAEARVCDCGREKVCIGEDVSERIGMVPAKIFVERHVYPKYACPCCKDGVTSAPVVANPIAGGLAGPGLLAYVWVNKFSEHLPMYRQQDVLWRHGIFLARSTLCDWMAQCAELVRPLYELLRLRVTQSEAINADETPVPVLDRTRDSTRTGYFWEYLSPGPHGYAFFDYRDSRSRDGPAEILKGFRGYLQTDAYASYESVVKESAGRIIPVGCWAHARREFFDARVYQPREAHYALALIGQLYDIEDEVRSQSPEVRRAARQERSVPILGRLEAFLREQKDVALPKSQFGKAVAYSLNHWPELNRYTENGILEIDNNVAERTLRPCAIGRKNWMFVGSDRGGETAAICLTMLANAKRYQIEPFAYVRALLVALASGDADLEALLPDVWIAAHPEHFLQYRRDESEAAAASRRRRRADRRAKARQSGSPS
jgi:transposase